MSKEVCEYRVSLRGRPVGSYRLTSLRKHNTVILEAQLDLQGPLGRKSVHQSSTIQQDSWVSLEFVETYRNGAETRTFEVIFDQNTGMVTARRGSRDQASVPYIQAYRDPLSIFYELRQTASERLHMPLVGKDVVLEHVSDVTLETSLGPKRALVYSCQPGGNYIYIEDNQDRAILKLSQRMDGQMLEASLVKVSYEAESRTSERPTRKRRTRSGMSRQSRVQQAGRQSSGQRGGRHRASRYQDRQQQGSQQPASQQPASQQGERNSSSQRSNSRRSNSQGSGSRDSDSQRSNSQRRNRSARKQGKQSTRRRNRNSQRQASPENTQNTASSEQQSQKSSQTKKRSGTRRNKSSRRPNRSRKDNSKSREDAE
ncbi:MAG: hypothetical protein AAF267_01960 [Deinococcota bacterium]